MKHSIQFAILLLSTCGLGQAQDVNDFFSGNGSFELGPHVSPLTFSRGGQQGSSYQVPGWRMVAWGTSPRWIEGSGAQDGQRYLRLGSRGGSGSAYTVASITGSEISHTPFTIGEVYELVFWASGGVGSAQASFLQVIMQGLAKQSIELPVYTEAEFESLGGPVWNEYVIPFTAQVESPELRFGSTPVSPGTATLYLDNISFRAVPEPGSALLVLGAGLGWLVAGRTRKRQLARA